VLAACVNKRRTTAAVDLRIGCSTGTSSVQSGDRLTQHAQWSASIARRSGANGPRDAQRPGGVAASVRTGARAAPPHRDHRGRRRSGVEQCCAVGTSSVHRVLGRAARPGLCRCRAPSCCGGASLEADDAAAGAGARNGAEARRWRGPSAACAADGGPRPRSSRPEMRVGDRHGLFVGAVQAAAPR